MARPGTLLPAGGFYGQTRVRHHAGGLLLSEVGHASARVLPRHAHQRAFFSLLLSGAYEEETGGRVLAYRPGTLGFHPPELEHADRVGTHGARFFTVEVEAAWLERVRELRPTAGMPVLLPAEASWMARHLYRECLRSLPGTALAVEALVLDLLVEACRVPPAADRRRPQWLKRVHEALHADPFRRWTVTALAAEVGRHPVHLARTVRRHEGRTLGDLARDVRIEAASTLLSRKTLTVAEVALQAGFADQSHFTRVFRRVTGLTPGAWRREPADPCSSS
jgi:AraC family transcriptional regulator